MTEQNKLLAKKLSIALVGAAVSFFIVRYLNQKFLKGA
jgi:hypothetical protein